MLVTKTLSRGFVLSQSTFHLVTDKMSRAGRGMHGDLLTRPVALAADAAAVLLARFRDATRTLL